ncbi:PREDICTED: nucleolar protein 58-like [Nicotiana attenuata]|uniref:Uncharacterized protein n=1 Tax=Nicotiana attenuata TaxID=49451 RepID=A0A314KMV2_NICAT|nr:PREDICTED: nucleolar protein 58-like [Nicotiana attenuata]OIT30542.1 hypothetical protein A4A49_14102 [Nicotiana attenuata]
MKTISGKLTSTTPISLSQAAKSLSKFAASENGASHSVSIYIQRAADSFNQLVQLHEKLRPNSAKNELSIKVEEISERRKKIGEVGIKAEDVVKNDDFPNGSQKSRKSNSLDKKSKKLDKDPKLIKTEHRLDISEGETAKSKKNELEFVKMDSYVKRESELEEVKEDGMISRDKKKKKKKNKVVGDNEGEVVGKVEEDSRVKEEEERKRKSVDHSEGENAGSAEQSNKKKSKKRRIEGEK